MVKRMLNRLTAKAVKNLKKPGYHPDGGGLYVQVARSGSKSWIFHYARAGKEREMGLGSLTTVSMVKARQQAEMYRALLQDGKDPMECKKARETQDKLADAKTISFRRCSEKYVEAHRADWKNEKHVDQWTNTLETYCGPVFGGLPVSEHPGDLLRPRVRRPAGVRGR